MVKDIRLLYRNKEKEEKDNDKGPNGMLAGTSYLTGRGIKKSRSNGTSQKVRR